MSDFDKAFDKFLLRLEEYQAARIHQQWLVSLALQADTDAVKGVNQRVEELKEKLKWQFRESLRFASYMGRGVKEEE